jgi:WD40 repeat protein
MATSSSTLPSPPPPFQVLSVIPTASYLALTSGPHVHLHSLSPPAFAPLASTSTLPAADQHSWLVRTTAVSADGRWIATGCDGKELRVWEVAEDASAIKLSSVRCGRAHCLDACARDPLQPD